MKEQPSLLTESDIRRFLGAKAWFGVCVSCGGREFSPLDETSLRARVALPVLKRDGEPRDSDGLFEVVLIACANCGLVNCHERRLIATWVANNPLS